MSLRPLCLLIVATLWACTDHQEPEVQTISVDDSESNDSQADQEQEIIEAISCDATYDLPVANIELLEGTSSENLDKTIDNDKTNQSVWQSSDSPHTLVFELEYPALVKEFVISWDEINNSHYFDIDLSTDNETWVNVIESSQSSKNYLIAERLNLETKSETAKFIKLTLNGNDLNNQNSIIEFEAFGCRQNTSHNIELIDWYLSVQTDTDNNGKSDSIKESDLNDGYYDPRFFYTSEDGGLTFSSSVKGYKTSTNTKYVRSELREMLRRGNNNHSTQGVNKNNWVFSSAPTSAQQNAGGVDGQLDVDLAVNHVTSTGDDYQIGRVIIGQIHANDDEPIRVYYRKLPGNNKGSIYLAHEILGGDDIYFEVIGSRDNSASNPEDGIPLNEPFQYQILVSGHTLTFTLTKNNGDKFTQVIDMSYSGYDAADQYMYFKAGVYNQNNSGDLHDFVQATFYSIVNLHSGYDY